MLAFLLLQLLFPTPGKALPLEPAEPPPADFERLVDLRGPWRFTLGDDLAWAAPSFDDDDWETIFAPAKWEDEGYFGYDGYAWYRRRFRLPTAPAGRPLYLDVGRIDDVGAVYLNGHFLGAVGRFPPEYHTGFHLVRRYRIPREFLNVGGTNVVAVRVYDDRLGGGMIEGKPGLYAAPKDAAITLDLGGSWKFRRGDRAAWSHPDYDDDGWGTITAPGRWEAQGHATYDGYAWYRKHFRVSARLRGKDLVVALGKIDDLDEVFLNGVRIGGTGDIDAGRVRGDEWQEIRLYSIPPGVLHYGGENVLAVRVYDGLYDGGIFEGPIGLAHPAEAAKLYMPPARKAEPFWQFLLRWFKEEEK